MLLMPLNIDDLTFARASLSGMAALGLLHARLVENIDMISDAGNLSDWRDPFESCFLAAIRSGNIRLDARWSKGADEDLVKFANASEEKEVPAIQTFQDVESDPSPAMEAGRKINASLGL